MQENNKPRRAKMLALLEREVIPIINFPVPTFLPVRWEYDRSSMFFARRFSEYALNLIEIGFSEEAIAVPEHSEIGSPVTRWRLTLDGVRFLKAFSFLKNYKGTAPFGMACLFELVVKAGDERQNLAEVESDSIYYGSLGDWSDLIYVVERFREAFWGSEFSRQLKWRVRFIKNTTSSVEKYVANLYAHHRRLMLVEVYLSYRDYQLRMEKGARKKIIERLYIDRSRLVGAFDQHQAFRGMAGWLMRVGFHYKVGFYIRIIFFFRENSGDSLVIAERIGKFWETHVTKQDGSYGRLYYSDGLRRGIRSEYRCGIYRRDRIMRKDFEKFIVRSLTSDLYVKILVGAPHRIFFRGEISNGGGQ